MSTATSPALRRPTERRPLSLWRKVAYSFLSLVIALAALEGAVRLRAWFRFGSMKRTAGIDLVPDPASGVPIPRPGTIKRGARESITIDSRGFRGREVVRPKPAGRIRIAALGGSTTFGTGSTDDAHTWPALLEERLRQYRPSVDWEVVNAGILGATVEQTGIDLVHRVLPVEPDFAILYSAHNDLVWDSRAVARAQGVPVDFGSCETGPFITLARNSLLIDLAYKNLVIRQSQQPGGARVHAMPPEMAAGFASRFEKVLDILDRAGVRVLVSTFPVKFRPEQDQATRLANADACFFYMPWVDIDGLMDGFDQYNRAILDLARRRHIQWVDLRNRVPADARHFIDAIHMTDAGCEQVADLFFAALRDSGWIERWTSQASQQPSAVPTTIKKETARK